VGLRANRAGLAVVGELQFEVAKYRLESEYGVKTAFTYLPFSLARRVAGDREAISRAQFPTNANCSRTGTASRSRSSRASGACAWPPNGTGPDVRAVFRPAGQGDRDLVTFRIPIALSACALLLSACSSENRYERQAGAITQAVANNDLAPWQATSRPA